MLPGLGGKPRMSLGVPQCAVCGLRVGCRSPAMKPDGEGRRKILVVGEAPGREEDEAGKPFVGPSGKKLKELFGTVGIELRRDCWLTNAIRCRPARNRKPNLQQIQACRPNLLKAIRELKPGLIVAVGDVAVSSLVGWLWKEGEGGISRFVGWVIPAVPLKTRVLPVYHPAFLLRQEDAVLDLLVVDWLKAGVRVMREPLPPPISEKQVKVVMCPAKAAETAKRFRRAGREVAIDYETTALKPEYPGARIVSCAVSDGDRTVAFPWLEPAVEEMRRLWLSEVPKVAHNWKFEARWTASAFGEFPRGPFFDTMIAAHVLDYRSGITSLKFQAFVRFGIGAYDRTVSEWMRTDDSVILNRIEEADRRKLLVYNGMDALITKRLADVQRAELDAN